MLLAILFLTFALIKCELNDATDKAVILEDIELSLLLMGRSVHENAIDKVINEATTNTAHQFPKSGRILTTFADELRRLVLAEVNKMERRNVELVEKALGEIKSLKDDENRGNAYYSDVKLIVDKTVKELHL